MITRRQFIDYLAVAAGGLLPWAQVWAGMRLAAGSSRSVEASGLFVFAQVHSRAAGKSISPPEFAR